MVTETHSWECEYDQKVDREFVKDQTDGRNDEYVPVALFVLGFTRISNRKNKYIFILTVTEVRAHPSVW